MDIKSFVKGNRVAFIRLRKGIAYYQVAADGVIYEFPVPLSDIGDATLMCADRAIYFMRYIKQAIADGTLVKVGQMGESLAALQKIVGSDAP